MKDITLSPKHGVNPAIPYCFFCGKAKNEILLMGRIRDDAEAPHGMVFDQQPCGECAKLMELGVLVISVRDGESGDNPYRTGKQLVMSEDWVRRVIAEPVQNQILTKRVAFIHEVTWKALGLNEAPEKGVLQ